MTIDQAVEFLFDQTAYAVYGIGHESGPYLAGNPVYGKKILTCRNGFGEAIYYTKEEIAASLKVGEIVTVYGDGSAEEDYTIKIV